jgi:hypothetical protein
MHRDPIRRGKLASVAASGPVQGRLADAAVISQSLHHDAVRMRQVPHFCGML